jgi:hypothetical protein
VKLGPECRKFFTVIGEAQSALASIVHDLFHHGTTGAAWEVTLSRDGNE